MIPYVARRLLDAAITLLIAATAVFFALRALPGGPFDTERALPPAVEAAVRAHYGLDRPLPAQFVDWLASVARGDGGVSFQYPDHTVGDLLAQALPASLGIGAAALALALTAGLVLGSLAAWARGGWLDAGAVFAAVAGMSLPPYLMASLLVLVFSFGLGWLPPALWDEPGAWILPALTLAVRPIALVARVTRASLIEALSTDYVRTAVGKGAGPMRAVVRHALRNALLPVCGLLGPLAANLATGSFLVEQLFQVPGLGRAFTQGVLNRDYPLVMGATLVFATFLLAANLASDVLAARLDPRVRLR